VGSLNRLTSAVAAASEAAGSWAGAGWAISSAAARGVCFGGAEVGTAQAGSNAARARTDKRARARIGEDSCCKSARKQGRGAANRSHTPIDNARPHLNRSRHGPQSYLGFGAAGGLVTLSSSRGAS